jgi:hypothetical protein
MAGQAALALKTEQDKNLARGEAEKAAGKELGHRELVLAVVKEENIRLLASLDHVRQVAQHIADMVARQLANAAKETAKVVKKAKAMAASEAGPHPFKRLPTSRPPRDMVP